MIKLLVLLLFICSCGKEKSKSKKRTPQEEINEDGIYYGEIGSFHKSASKGHIKINKIGDSVEVTVKVTGNSTEQYLYEGSYCPATAPEVATTSGKRLMGFDVGTHESSYSLMLADLGKDAIRFEDKTFIVFQGGNAVGCADINRYFEDPPFPEPEAPRKPTTRRPRPQDPPEYEPPAPPPREERTSWWERLSDRLRRWWCRVRRRCA